MARNSSKPKPVRRVIGDYEGSDIVGSAIKLTGGGTGLNDGLTLDGKRFIRNERVAVLVEGRIKNVGYGDADKDEQDECIEIGTLQIEQGRIVSPSIAADMLREENERVAKLRDDMNGTPSMFSEGGDGEGAAAADKPDDEPF